MFGKGALADAARVHVVGATAGSPIGINQAIWLSARVLKIARSDDAAPILFLVDTSSQRMSRRDELLGLNEYLAHLAKSLLLAEAKGHRTIGLLYGRQRRRRIHRHRARLRHVGGAARRAS